VFFDVFLVILFVYLTNHIFIYCQYFNSEIYLLEQLAKDCLK